MIDAAASQRLGISGNISGAGSLTVGDGTGTYTGLVVLGGTNNFGGGTTVASGTLVVNNAGALPAGGSLSIGPGGTFLFDPTVMPRDISASPAAAPVGGSAANAAATTMPAAAAAATATDTPATVAVTAAPAAAHDAVLQTYVAPPAAADWAVLWLAEQSQQQSPVPAAATADAALLDLEYSP